MPAKFRIVEWGDCLYLAESSDKTLQDFCRAALKPISAARFDHSYRIYLRESDREKTPTGWPRLPAKVWVQFVLDEITFRHEECFSRTALESLLPAKAGQGDYRGTRKP